MKKHKPSAFSHQPSAKTSLWLSAICYLPSATKTFLRLAFITLLSQTSLISPISQALPRLSQEGFIRFTKKTLITYLIIFTAFSGTGLAFLFNPFGTKSAEAAWFNDNWGYRKVIQVTSHTAAENNVYQTLTVDTAALTTDKLQADCDDLRFTKVNGDILPYQIVSGCDTSTTSIRVGFDTMPAAPFDFYMYYGNPSVSAGSTTLTHSACANSCATISSFGSEVNGPSPVSYWKFDDGQGTAAANSTTTASINGTTDGSWQTENQCISGKCLLFNGTSQETTVGSSSTLNTANFTLSTWVNWAGVPTGTEDDTIIERGQNATNKYNYYFYLDANGSDCGTGVSCLALGFSNNADDAYITGHYIAFTPTSNTWYNIVAQMDDTNNTFKFFINGVQVLSEAESSVPNTGGTQTISIGRNVAADAFSYLKGFVDEYKIYNYVLSADQVKANFNARSNPEGVSSALGANTQNMPAALSNGLVGYWKMDETSGNPSDSSGNTVTLTNNSSTAYASGKFGNAGSFVAASTDYFSTATTISGVQTVSFWTNNASTSDEYINLTSSAYITSSSGTVSATGFTSPSIYVNGVLNGTLTASVWNHVVITSATAINANQFEIGRANSAYNNGKIDDARVYNRALSSAEISQLYNWAPGPVGYWKMDEASWTNDCSTTSVIDSSGNGYNGKSCPSTTGPTGGNTGKYGKAGNFDGSDDYLIASPTLPTGDFTYETWYKANATVISYGLFSAEQNASDSDYFVFYLNFGIPTLLIGGSSIAASSTTYNTFGTWYHAAVTRSGSSVKIYINGVQDGSGTSATTLSFGSCNLILGADAANCSTPGGVYLNGTLDDAKVYNYARSQGQVVEDMNAGHPAPGSPVGTPLGYWKFNEGADNTCSGGSNDVCNSGNGGSTIDGAQTNMAVPATATSGWTQSGKVGKALIFDGSNDFVSMGDIAGTDSVSQATWTFWANPGTLSTDDCLWCKVNTPTATPAQSSWAIMTDSSDSSIIRAKIANGAADVSQYGSSPTGTLVNGTWAYVAVVYDGTLAAADRIKFYVNGKPVTTTITGTIPTTIRNSTANAVFGRASSTAVALYTGTIDEPKLYLSALTADQIKLDMNQGSGQVQGALSNNASYQPNAANQEYCIPGDATTCTAPVARWDLEEGLGTSANDTTGNANTGTITAGSGGYAKGKIGKSYSFDGASTSINSGSATSLDNLPAAGMTLEGWIYPRTVGEGSNGFVLVKNSGASASAGWIFHYTSGNALLFTVDGATDLVHTTSTTVPLNTWTHVALSWDGVITTASSARIYINGVEASYATTTNGATRVDDAASSFYIGNDSGSARTFDGFIDNVRVFNYARTASQIAWDYNKGGAIAHWKMDECQGTTINDSSGVGNTGTLTIGASGEDTVGTCTTASTAWGSGATGKRNYSLSFDATDDYISVADSPSYYSTTFSVSSWIKPAVVNATKYFVSKRTGSGAGEEFALNITTSGTVQFAVWDSGGSSILSVTSNRVLTADQWYFITATTDGTTGKVYINGQLDNSANQTGTRNDSTSSLAIGRCSVAGTCTNEATRHYSGLIDDTRLYNYPLTATQTKTLYNEGATRYGPVTGAP